LSTRLGVAGPSDINLHLKTLELCTHSDRCPWTREIPKARLLVPMASGQPCVLPQRPDVGAKLERSGEEFDEADMWTQASFVLF
jgi:hypothetical protein